jgi:CO/xanthine dehydrogenase Mo-binding subunit
VIGTPVKRLDGPDKVTGRAKYTFDIARPGSSTRASSDRRIRTHELCRSI